MNVRRQIGLHTALVALVAPVALIATGLALSQPALFELLRQTSSRRAIDGALVGLGVLGLFSLALGVTAQRAPRGMPGRLRGSVLGYAVAIFAISAAGLGILLRVVAPELPAGALITPEDALALFPQRVRIALFTLTGAGLPAALATLGSLVGAWFLVPLRVRRAVFAVLDIALLAACAWLSFRFGFRPTSSAPQDLAGPTARLVTTFVLGVRLGARALPYCLDLIERFDFRALVAARHLRAKKSGFLAAISFLSILAVSVSSCALTTTLSVMGGFRQDLKRKILGNNAHIVIDRADDRIAGYEQLIARTRSVQDVRGVSPYVSGEVMISSASNLAGAVLRGIDVAHIGEVSELPSNMKVGSLDYLVHPDKLTHLPASQIGLSLGLPKVSRFDDEGGAKPVNGKRLSDDLDDLMDEAARAAAGKNAPDEPEEEPGKEASAEPKAAPRSALPGIVVGQELARSLRLYLGDEVNVVTPLGELGPTGPMPKSRPFRVAGIFYSGMYEYDMKFAYVTLESAQKFLGAGGAVSGIEITVREPDRAQDVASTVAARLGRKGLRVRPWQELNKNLFGALALEKLAMFIALGIAILVASFCIVGTLTLMVQEKGREVAVLKAMGAADRAIVSIFVLEGTLIGVFGSLLGLALGYVMCFAMEHFGVRLNPEVYYIDRLPVHIDSTEFLTVGIAAVIVCLFVTIYPAQLASRLRPVDALRYE